MILKHDLKARKQVQVKVLLKPFNFWLEPKPSIGMKLWIGTVELM